ncbi:hypothetical protein BCV72DRAFT_321036 [Rhizopus microsporus var. microsporus]|uniref:SMAD/FHA domain-containing protein n=1 Tax=Rhizopus microsporus var. microsporus TaxID=86635 RepID=A0A1X0RAV3_RHIZD|nr:hypothetical protein BCV72DRAFT_321036 [Rhizopus microsporus var. microsporus]
MAILSENRRRSISGASALLTRRFTRQATTNNSKPDIVRRRATIAIKPPKVHVRIVPSIDNPGRSLIFDIVDRDLEYGTIIKIGRYSERNPNNSDCMSFKSKVVSRCHCEIFVEQDGKLYIRDTKSSSGTFLNHIRLSPAGQESQSVEIHDGDLVQLGVDYQGGREEIYRSVRMKFEINHRHRPRPVSFSLTAFQNLRSLTTSSSTDLDECCICLYSLAPFQALFVAPCSHTFHFKCIRPLFQSYPGFQCPMCRTYSDLEASVDHQVIEENDGHDTMYHQNNDNNDEFNLQSSPIFIQSDDVVPLESNNINRISTAVMDSPSHQDNTTDGPSLEPIARERKTSYIMDKIKTVLFEKRKTTMISSISIKRRHRRERPMSFPNLGGPSNVLSQQQSIT